MQWRGGDWEEEKWKKSNSGIEERKRSRKGGKKTRSVIRVHVMLERIYMIS